MVGFHEKNLMWVVFAVYISIGGFYGSGVSGSNDHTGSQFSIAFMEHGLPDANVTMRIHIINHDPVDITVQLTYPTSALETLTVPTLGEYKHIVPPHLVMHTNEQIQKVIHAQVIGPYNLLPSVYISMDGTEASDSTLVLPDVAQGEDYYAVTYCEIFGLCQIVIASSLTPAAVSVTLPTSSDVSVNINSVIYTSGQTFDLNLQMQDAVQIQCKCDLTGTRIQNITGGTFSVFAGSYGVMVGVGGDKDILVEQMLPVKMWGKEYIVYANTLRQTGDFVRIVTSQINTIIKMSGYITVKLSNAGSFLHRRIESGSGVYIRADKPVMVVQFTLNKETNDLRHFDSSMFVVQSMEQFHDTYTFSTITDNTLSKNYLVISTSMGDEVDIFLDGMKLTDQSILSKATIPEKSVVVGVQEVSFGRHVIQSNTSFGVHLLSEDQGRVFGQLIGTRTSILDSGSSKPSVPGDQVDNDGDNLIDEGLCTESDLLSSSVTSDCGKVLGQQTEAGMLFLLVFPEMGTSSADMKFYVTDLESSTDITYTIVNNGNHVTHTEPVTSNYERMVPDEMMVVNTGIYKNNYTLLVNATKNVVIFASYQNSEYMYQYLALPVNMLGLEYFAVTYVSGNNVNNTLTVVAGYDNTHVSVHLPYLEGMNFTFQGRIYNDYEVIHVTLQQYQLVHFRELVDFTGTLIRASNPVAVFSGGDDYLEQLFPVEYYGKTFISPILPPVFQTGILRVVVSEGNTVCEIRNNDQYTTVHITTNAGERIDQEITSVSDSYIITCKKPAQVTLFVKGTTFGGAMLNILPSRLLKTSYHFQNPNVSSNLHLSIQRVSSRFLVNVNLNNVLKRSDSVSRYYETFPSNINGFEVDVRSQYLNESFAAYVISETNHLMSGSTGGINFRVFSQVCVPTPNVVGDGIDNDCDGLKDEDVCVLDVYKYEPDVHIVAEKYIPDFDLDGSLDEDCEFEMTISSSTEMTSSTIEPTMSSIFSAIPTTSYNIESSEITHVIPSDTTSVVLSWEVTNVYPSETTSVILSSEVTNVFPSETTSVIMSSSVSTSTQCKCPCSKAQAASKYQNLTAEKIEQIVEEIKKELTVEKSNLSSAIRKKTSAKDDRPTAKGVGAIGIVFFVIVFAGLILSDFTAIVEQVKTLRDNLCNFG